MHNTISTMEGKVLVSLSTIVLLATVVSCISHSPSSTILNQQTKDQQSVSVQTTSGLLNGIKENLLHMHNSSIYKFLSVPYAEAPLETLRFKKPVEIKDRGQTLVDASKFGKTCPQYRHLTRFISPLLNVDHEHQTSEDCLHLNIYVPASIGSVDKNEGNKLEPNKQLPVIVWIPGEGFDFADARQFDGSFLAQKTQSIVVTVQYRVGVLGFLHAPKLGVTGNMGIYDQIMALRWVNKNIEAFGGDSERVSVMGRFSGSMSISAMITAPKQELIQQNGRTLFSRVAMLSGVAVDDWIISSKQQERVETLEKSALAKGYCSKSQIEDETCLQNIPLDQLMLIADFGWRLVVDDELIGSVSPINAIQANQFSVDLEGVLVGETGMEGTLCLYRHMLQAGNNNYAQLIDENKLTTEDLYEIIRDDSSTYFQYNITKTNPIQAALESMVENSNMRMINSESRLRDKYLNACSSYMVKSHSNKFKRNILARNELVINRMDSSKRPVEVYHYELKYKPTFSLAPSYIKTAAHGDDIPLIFGLIYSQPKRETSEADLLMTRKLMAYIGNFIHGNNPLLGQHGNIESRTDSTTKLNENDTTSLDENESMNNLDIFNQQQGSRNIPKRSWSSEGQIYMVDFTERDHIEINKNSQNDGISQVDREHQLKPEAKSNEKPNFRIIVVENPTQILENHVADIRSQSTVESVEQQQSNAHHELEQLQQKEFENRSPIAFTKSQRLMELHRQHLLEDNLWIQNSRKSMQQAQTSAMTMVNESSFLTLIVFSSCIVIFALLSLCIGLCLVIFRNNLAASKAIQQFTNSASSCNICDDSHGSGMDAVLGNDRKHGRGFSNVFDKLRNHNNLTVTSAQPSCATSTSRQNSNGATESVIVHQRIEASSNQAEH